MKHFQIMGAIFGILFLILFSIRLDLFSKSPSGGNSVSLESPSERDTWMNIFQDGHKIGFSHSLFSRGEDGYLMIETVLMRINTLGITQEMNLKTAAMLNPDFTLSSVDFALDSGLFSFSAKGRVSGGVISFESPSFGAGPVEFEFDNPPYLMGSITDAVNAAGFKPGDTFFFDIFDPSTMSQGTVEVSVISREEILNMGVAKPATRVSLMFRGASQLAWIGEDGDILREKGILGITLEKTSQEDALSEIEASSQDMTKIASVASNRQIEHPEQLDILRVEISGISLDHLHIHGGRQTLEGNTLFIQKESVSDIRVSEPAEMSEFLEPTPFIQSDHEKIRNLAKEVVSPDDTRLKKAKKLFQWVHEHIEKRPVLSLPDAVSTLENRMGDCNEHAMLLAALARAASIPARVETGLVYQKGRFYYHAWNLLHVGDWITADAALGQFPADVTHIRLATGEQQLDLIGTIGKIRLKIVE